MALEQLIADLSSAEFQHGVEHGFWDFVDREGMILYINVHAPDGRDYLAQLDCENYGCEPIACKFVDPKTRLCANEAWPAGNNIFGQWVKFGDPKPFICWNQDRIGIEHHQEWRQHKPWTKRPNQLVTYLDFLRKLLHLESWGYHRLLRPAA
jgi:hypothetical protein